MVSMRARECACVCVHGVCICLGMGVGGEEDGRSQHFWNIAWLFEKKQKK